MKCNKKRHVVVQPQDQSIKLIPLTKGYNAVVDAEEYVFFNKMDWFALTAKKSKVVYARSYDLKTRKPVLMHKMIYPQWEEVDHIDGDGLNNRKNNLRESTHSENMANRGMNSNNTSGYKGAYFHKISKCWYSAIKINGKMLYLGICKDVVEAARRYDVKAIELFGEFAQTNFPRYDYECHTSPVPTSTSPTKSC